MRTFMLSALWVRVLLAMLVALEFVVDLVRARTIENEPYYRSCINNPFGCTQLFISTSGLTGTIPTEIGRLTAATFLSMNSNELTSSIPTEIGRLTALEYLGMGYNELTSSIPTEIGRMTALVELSMNKNGLTGTIPTEIGRRTALTSLRMDNNELTSSLPTEIGRLTALVDLWIFNNTGLCGDLVSVGSVGTIGIGGTNLGNACPSSPPPPSPPPELAECASWASAGECSRNPSYMLNYCAASCLMQPPSPPPSSPSPPPSPPPLTDVVEFSCVGDLTNPAGRAAHIEQCMEQYLTGDDLWIPEDQAVPGKSVSTATRTADTVTFRLTDCGMDERGAFCDEYWLHKDANGEPVDLNCDDSDWSQRTWGVLGPGSSTSPSWPIAWTACSAHDIDDQDDANDYDDPNAKLAYTTGGPQFYVEYKAFCEPGVGTYDIDRYRHGGADAYVPVQSFTMTYTCGVPYPTYRLEFERSGAATVTTMSETPTCEDTCGVTDVDVAQWTEDQAECVSQCIKNSATTHAGAVGLVVGALAAAMYAFF